MRNLRVGLLLAVRALCAGQQGFPLKSGEWEATPDAQNMKLPPVRLCFNDASWIQAMWPNPKCKIERLAVRATGATFNISCSGDPGHLDGTVEIKFDGKEHMTSTTKGKMTFKDKALDTTAVNDWRWKNAQCSADDINLLKKSGK